MSFWFCIFGKEIFALLLMFKKGLDLISFLFKLKGFVAFEPKPISFFSSLKFLENILVSILLLDEKFKALASFLESKF